MLTGDSAGCRWVRTPHLRNTVLVTFLDMVFFDVVNPSQA
jgi:hypothetical protein